MAVVTIADVPHIYDRSGAPDAPQTLVFVHGWLLSRHYWQPVIQPLQADFQCIAYDLRGFGESQAAASLPASSPPLPSSSSSLSSNGHTPPEPSPYSLTAYADDLGALIQQLQLHNVWVIGHSLGGSIALWAAHRFPQQIQGVICVNAGGGIYLKEEFEKFRAVGQQLVKFRPRWLSQIPFLDRVFARDSVANPVARTWGKQRLIDFVAAEAAAAREALLESTTEAEVHRLPQIVRQLQQPVHFIAGANDTVMEPQYVRHLASFHGDFVNGTTITELPSCGHLSMIEQPQQVAQIIQSVVQAA